MCRAVSGGPTQNPRRPGHPPPRPTRGMQRECQIPWASLMRTSPNRSYSDAPSEVVDLGRHDEIVSSESLRGVGQELQGHLVPRVVDVGVMALGFG